MMRASAAAVAALTFALAGCGGDDSSEQRKRASTTAREVGAVVEALERATARRDYRTICERLFSSAVREQAGGERCPAMLRRTAREVRNPRLTVEDIRVRGDRARVRVATTAAGQAPAPEVLELVREGGRWRIEAIGG